MTEKEHTLQTFIRRPQDCSKKMKSLFIQIATAGGEADAYRVKNSLAYTEALFFIGIGTNIIGVSALLRPRLDYLKHLFENAGVPQMCNPYSVESCWLSVLQEHRGKGIWRHARAAKLEYMGNRPFHSVRRVDNTNVSNLQKENEYTVAGTEFYSHISKDKLRLMVANHDPVYDPKKTLVYM